MTLANIQYSAAPTGELAPMPRQATRDDQLVNLWLHGRSPHTQRAYRADVTLLKLWFSGTLDEPDSRPHRGHRAPET